MEAIAQLAPVSTPWYENPAIWTQIGLIVTVVFGFLTLLVQRYFDRAKIDEVGREVYVAKTERAEATRAVSNKMEELAGGITAKVEENTQLTEGISRAANGMKDALVASTMAEGRAFGRDEERAKGEARDSAKLTGAAEERARADAAGPSVINQKG